MSITKNVLLNWYPSMKKNEKDSDDIWHRKLTLKVKFWHFLTLFDTSRLTQFSKFNNFLGLIYVYYYKIKMLTSLLYRFWHFQANHAWIRTCQMKVFTYLLTKVGKLKDVVCICQMWQVITMKITGSEYNSRKSL